MAIIRSLYFNRQFWLLNTILSRVCTGMTRNNRGRGCQVYLGPNDVHVSKKCTCTKCNRRNESVSHKNKFKKKLGAVNAVWDLWYLHFSLRESTCSEQCKNSCCTQLHLVLLLSIGFKHICFDLLPERNGSASNARGYLQFCRLPFAKCIFCAFEIEQGEQ